MKASDVKAFAQELRPHIEAAIDSAEVLKGMAAAAREKGIDWGELKKLVKAQVQDSREGTDKRGAALIEKADFAASYADMLGFASKMNDFSESRSSEPAPQQPEPASRTILREQLTASIALADTDFPEIPSNLDRRVRA